MKVYAAEGAQRDSLCYGCTRRRLGCRKGCTRGAEEEIMKILLAGEREKKAPAGAGHERNEGGQHYPENAPGEEGRIEMSTRMVAAAIRTAGESETAGALGDALLARELERTRAELKRVTAERDLLAWGIREGNRRKTEELEKKMKEKARRKNRWKRVAALFVIREED